MYAIGSNWAKLSAANSRLLSGGKQAPRKLKRAQILLAADAGVSDDDIATSVGVGGSTVYERTADARTVPGSRRDVFVHSS